MKGQSGLKQHLDSIVGGLPGCLVRFDTWVDMSANCFCRLAVLSFRG